MTLVWNDRRRGFGVGLQAFYHQLAMSYLNIKKTHTDAFLTSKGDYQIQKTPQPKSIKPILIRNPNERWGMLLIDMSVGLGEFRTRRYILTVVDYSSGYVWARYMTNNSAATIINELNNICTSPPPLGSNTYPTVFQSDNGSEFSNAAVANWMATNNIQHIFTQSYSPKSNGKVERKSREIRKKIKAVFLRTNSKVWIAYLQDYVANINAQQDYRKKMSANQLWLQGHPPFPVAAPQTGVYLTPAQAAVIERNFLERRAARWTHGALPRFQVGDEVRVNLFSLSSEYRKKVKELREHFVKKLRGR
jgi:transposase InsO family protein